MRRRHPSSTRTDTLVPYTTLFRSTHVLSNGGRRVGGFIAGFVVGVLVWFTLASTGVAMLAQRAQMLLLIIKYLGAAYFMYLAIQMWFAPVSRLDEEKDTAIPIRTGRLFIASLMLTMGNPKVMVFFIALLPLIIDLRSMTMGLYAAVALAIVVILSGVLFAYTFAALRARRLFRSPFALRWLIAYRARRWAARLWSSSPDDAWLASKPARGE